MLQENERLDWQMPSRGRICRREVDGDPRYVGMKKKKKRRIIASAARWEESAFEREADPISPGPGGPKSPLGSELESTPVASSRSITTPCRINTTLQ